MKQSIRSRSRKILPPFATLTVSLMLFADIAATSSDGTADHATHTDLGAGEAEGRATKQIIGMLTREHYSRRSLDKVISQQWFDSYFDRLDPNRSYFLESDLSDFSEDRDALCYRVQKGDIDFAYDVYKRFLERVRDRVDFVKQRLADPFDFTLEEEIHVSRANQPWCSTREELDDLWRRLLKNDLLIYAPAVLNAQVQMEDREVGLDNVASPIDADQAQRMAPRPPKERILRFYEARLAHHTMRSSFDVLELYMNALLGLFDPRSSYSAPQTIEDFEIEAKLSLCGVGLLLKNDSPWVRVAEVLPGGPAAASGRLMPGDGIFAVAEHGGEPIDTAGMPVHRVVRLLRGQKDTTISVWVLSRFDNSAKVVDLVRDHFAFPEQGARLEIRTLSSLRRDAPRSDDGIAVAHNYCAGIIVLPSFYASFGFKQGKQEDVRSATRDVSRLIHDARAQAVDGIVLDLRGNGGGSLMEAVTVAGLFIGGNPIVQIRETRGRVRILPAPKTESIYSDPLVILVDRRSAGASEIVAASLQDYRRAVIVGGDSTHGGTGIATARNIGGQVHDDQTMSERSLGMLTLVTGQYYRPSGKGLQMRGVIPDIKVATVLDITEGDATFQPHILPYDQIAAVDMVRSVVISDHLDELCTLSHNRLAANSEYRAFLDILARYAKIRERCCIPLDTHRRLRQMDEMKIVTGELNVSGRALSEPSIQAQKDFVLDEGLQVLADLIRLTHAGRTEP